MTTKPLRRQPDLTLLLLLQMSGYVHLNPGPATQYLCPVCDCNVISRGVSYQCNICFGWVHAKCSGLLNAAQYRRSSDWACDPCSIPKPSPPPTPIPPTELRVVMENKVKVAVIQESNLTPKSKNPCIQNYNTVRKDRPHGLGGGLLIFIHRSVTFSKQPSSAESLYESHLEELAIEAEIGNTKLTISNIYIPPASSCSNGYQSLIERLIHGDFKAHHPSWYSGSTDTRGRKMADSINGSGHGILNWNTPTRVPPNPEPSSPDSLASASLITSCSWQTLSTLS